MWIEPSYGCWKLNLVPLQKWQMFFTDERSLQLHAFFIKQKFKSNFSSSCILGWPLKHGQLTRASILIKTNQHFLSQKPPIANSSGTTGGTLWPTPVSMLGFGLVWAFAGFLHIVTTTVSLYMQLPGYIQKTQFLCSHLTLLVLTIFLYPLPK